MFNVKISKGEYTCGMGEGQPEPPSSFMGSIPHDLNQLTFN